MSQGVVFWRGVSPIDGAPLVAIATGLETPSANRKTGPMIQTYVLRADVLPTRAVREGLDSSVCGDCVHRGDGTGGARSCYVQVWRDPNGVWRAYERGSYPDVTPEECAQLFSGRRVRLGAYGDPAMIPLDVVERVLVHANGWTGYTHQWRTASPAWAEYVMASCDSTSDHRQARALGYRSFVVVPIGAALPSGTVQCMAERSTNPRQCVTCLACAGTRKGTVSGAVDIAITAHGVGAKHVRADSLVMMATSQN